MLAVGQRAPRYRVKALTGVIEFLFGIFLVWIGLFLLIYLCVFIHRASRRWLNKPQQDTFDFWVLVIVATAIVVYAVFFAGPMYSHRLN